MNSIVLYNSNQTITLCNNASYSTLRVEYALTCVGQLIITGAIVFLLRSSPYSFRLRPLPRLLHCESSCNLSRITHGYGAWRGRIRMTEFFRCCRRSELLLCEWPFIVSTSVHIINFGSDRTSRCVLRTAEWNNWDAKKPLLTDPEIWDGCRCLDLSNWKASNSERAGYPSISGQTSNGKVASALTPQLTMIPFPFVTLTTSLAVTHQFLLASTIPSFRLSRQVHRHTQSRILLILVLIKIGFRWYGRRGSVNGKD